MGILSNLLGSRKKEYRRGLQDAMNAYESFGNKQEKALNKIREEVRGGNKRMEDMLNAFGEDINGIYDYLTDQEKAALYNLCTPKDVNSLYEAEKRVLIAILYQLINIESEDRITEYQRKYIRSIQSYLGITNPQMEIDLQTIENIDSNDVQKAMLQVVLEFLYLQGVKSLSDEQEELLTYFSLNQHQVKKIEDYVVKLYRAVGAEGICEKYGFVPEVDINDEYNNMTQIAKRSGNNLITMGSWYDEEIQWCVLEKLEDRMLLMTVKTYTDFLDFSDHADACSTIYAVSKMFWSTSYLRKSLNEWVYEKAFSEEEKSIICTTSLDNKKCAKYYYMWDSTQRASAHQTEEYYNHNTEDKLFILSEDEIEKYLSGANSKYLDSGNFGEESRNWWVRKCTTTNRYACDNVHGEMAGYTWDISHFDIDEGKVVDKTFGKYDGVQAIKLGKRSYGTRIAMWVRI